MTTFSRKESASCMLIYYSNEPAQKPPKRVVLCIPGLGASSIDYLPLLENLALQHPQNLYVAVDTPGQGDSPALLEETPTVSTLVAPIGHLYNELDRPTQGLVVIGHSMGCRLALELFSHHSDMVTAVVLIEGNWNGSQKNQAPLPSASDLPPRDVAIKYMLHNLEALFGPHTPTEFKDEQKKLVMNANLPYQAHLLVANRRWDGERMIEVLQQIKTVHETGHPVKFLLVQSTDNASGQRRCLMAGEESPWMRTVRENAQDACTGIVVLDAGHWPQIDKTSEVAGAIISLIF